MKIGAWNADICFLKRDGIVNCASGAQAMTRRMYPELILWMIMQILISLYCLGILLGALSQDNFVVDSSAVPTRFGYSLHGTYFSAINSIDWMLAGRPGFTA